MPNRLLRHVMLMGLLAGLPMPAWAQNTSIATSVHMLVGQTPMVVTLPTATPDRYYDAAVVATRSYCAEATAAETETAQTDPVLVVYADSGGTTPLGTDTGTTTEPKGLTAARVCFIAPATQTVYLKLSPSGGAGGGFDNLAYSLRFVETTLWANWFFVGSDYSSFTLLRNTTNMAVSFDLRWRSDAGALVATRLAQTIPANGVIFLDARGTGLLNCPYPTACATIAGSVEVAHTGSPEAIVGSQTTLASSTGLSFDTLLFQRRAW